MVAGFVLSLGMVTTACAEPGHDGAADPWPVWDPGGEQAGGGLVGEANGEGAPDHVDLSGLAGPAAETGRFQMTVAYGVEGAFHTEIDVWGAFDHGAGSAEFGMHLDPLVGQLAEWGMADVPHDVPSDFVVRIVDGEVYLSGEVGEGATWVAVPVDSAEAPVDLGVVQPDELLMLVAAAAHEVDAADGPVLDGTPTRHYTGWLGVEAFDAVSTQGSNGTVGELMVGVPPGLFDRLMRFDAWVGDDGVARRLLIELDHEGMLDMAEVVDGYRDASAPRVTIRYEVEWFDVDQAVDISAPDPGELAGDHDPPPGR